MSQGKVLCSCRRDTKKLLSFFAINTFLVELFKDENAQWGEFCYWINCFEGHIFSIMYGASA